MAAPLGCCCKLSSWPKAFLAQPFVWEVSPSMSSGESGQIKVVEG
jgi:hypothetical protein